MFPKNPMTLIDGRYTSRKLSIPEIVEEFEKSSQLVSKEEFILLSLSLSEVDVLGFVFLQPGFKFLSQLRVI